MPKNKENSPYKLSLVINGQTYHSEGATLLEAIKLLKPQGIIKMQKGTLTIEHDGKKVERFLAIRQMGRLFNPNTGFGIEIAREAFTKFLNTLI